ncbi:MAG TPA: PucR family transcriptional regulator ligand-binding domain-containing protein [Egicoccus sp.]|nr:PucR family transcriptional regulator ligand-binding domain-containing protein [Egicoccus sp.]HSK22712.1 PucR family transcriptional regulator ligand-binding domain-containing protein [Egicoccus sp.]
MPLWPSELLADPGLGLELVAGRAGLDRRGPIRWAHISDTPDPTPWLEGGELLLTTGLGVKDSATLQQRLIAGLAERGVVAVGFGTGVSLEAVPPAMVAACETHDLPLITVPYEVPFLAVTRRVSSHIYEEHFATLRSAVALHRQVLATVTAGQGIAAVLRTVGRAMPGATLLAFDFAGAELARHDPAGRLDTIDLARLWSSPTAPGTPPPLGDGQAVTRAPLRIGDELEAVVVAVTDQPLLEHEVLLFEQGLAGVSLELSRRRSVREARRDRVDELLEETAAGRSTSGLIARALDRLGVPAPSAYRMLAVARPQGATDDQLCTVVEDALLPLGRPVVGHLDGTLFAMVPEGDDDAAARLVAAMGSRGWRQPRIGRSRPKRDLDALRSALREANVALLIDDPAPVRDVDQLGIGGLVAGIRDDLGATEFVDQVLGSVLAHDDRESSHLVATLRAYLAHGCRPGPAAAELNVHRHTLTYRLDRIRELTGRDPRSGDHLLEYGLALELLDRPPAEPPQGLE